MFDNIYINKILDLEKSAAVSLRSIKDRGNERISRRVVPSLNGTTGSAQGLYGPILPESSRLGHATSGHTGVPLPRDIILQPAPLFQHEGVPGRIGVQGTAQPTNTLLLEHKPQVPVSHRLEHMSPRLDGGSLSRDMVLQPTSVLEGKGIPGPTPQFQPNAVASSVEGKIQAQAVAKDLAKATKPAVAKGMSLGAKLGLGGLAAAGLAGGAYYAMNNNHHKKRASAIEGLIDAGYSLDQALAILG